MAKRMSWNLLSMCIVLALAAASSAQNGSFTKGDTTNEPREGDHQPDDVCFQHLGCFPMSFPWWSNSRPVPAPETPEKIATSFFLFTRNQPRRTHVITRPTISLHNVDYNVKRPTIFITHGFSSDSNTTWMIDMKDALLDKVDANVFLTDWGPGAAGLLQYKNAVSNTRVVSAEMSRLIEHMMNNYGVNPRSIHLIGHSLGAHISSYTGKRIKTIGRLTALDPAQPAFEGHTKEVRLDPTDAEFVEVIHTDAKPTIPFFGFGMIAPHGHVDYYINGGFTQPGCLIPEKHPDANDCLQLPCDVISNIVSCPHGRAALVFTEAIRFANCTFWGHPSNKVKKFLGAITRGFLHRYLTPSNNCNADNCSPMNLDNIDYPGRGSFVVATTSGSPYCIHEPKVDANMAKELMCRSRGRGGRTTNGIKKPSPHHSQNQCTLSRSYIYHLKQTMTCS